MRIVFWGKGARGVSCLDALCAAGRAPALVVGQPGDEALPAAAGRHGLPLIVPDDPNTAEVGARLAAEGADLFVLAGYGKILARDTIEVPSMMALNLHAGRLPEYRGSSPLNWALINGDESFGLSIIAVDAGVDTGPVICAREFPIGPDDTIADLHEVANREFPEMLIEAVGQIESGEYTLTPQDEARAGYFPVRFPEDGSVLWDTMDAIEIHNRVRALTAPYPGAFTYWGDRKVVLLATALESPPFHGEPGRIYRCEGDRFLVCARDTCLWVTAAVFEDGSSVADSLSRYGRFRTLRDAVLPPGDA
jgi:methionyl-tRNA formyltransferase